MDPTDISNRSNPSTSTNPLPGNTTVTKPSNNSAADTIMAHDKVSLPPRPTPITTCNTEHRNYTLTIVGFSTLPTAMKITITRFRASISQFWDLATPASAFPPQYLPDPDSHNWDFALMNSLNKLAHLLRIVYRFQALSFAVYHMKERNGELG